MVQAGPQSAARRNPENLSLVFQEIMTAIVRLRSGRQPVNDANLFRTQIRGALASAENDAVQRGYSQDDARLATFAVVAFLDESVLNSSNPVFSDWARMPLQEELYGHHMAGEVFFENIQKLLLRTDGAHAADVLELYAVCLLMGYLGRYRLTDPAGVHPVIQTVVDAIRRVRGGPTELAPGWAPPSDRVQVSGGDPWLKRLMVIAVASAVLALLMFGGFMLLLNAGASELRATAALLLG
jgi:type VI secretion system protein ImpK